MTLSIEEFRTVLPPALKKNINQDLIDEINLTLAEPGMYDTYRDNLIGFTQVMTEGKFQIENYLTAVKYVSYKLMGCTNIDAFIKTFHAKYTDWVSQGISAKDISSYVSAYNKGKLVNLIMKQTLIPHHVYNQDLYQKALMVQVDLMQNAASEKVRSDAANSVLVQLRQPDEVKIKMDIAVTENSALADLRQSTQELIAAQKLAIQSGLQNAQQIAHARLVIDMGDVETVEVKP